MFWTDYTYENDLMVEPPLKGNDLCKVEMEYQGKFGHTLGRIQHIFIMGRIGICYIACCPGNQNVAPNVTGYQVLKRGIKYLDSHPHKTMFYPSDYYDDSNAIRLTWSGNQVEERTTQHFIQQHQDADHYRILNIKRSVSGNIHTILGVAV